MEEIMINEIYCRRCSHSWIPRKNKIFVCPRCKSPKWSEEEGIIRINPNTDIDIILNNIVSNPIFSQDLFEIGQVVRS
jgi:hypothetical protein